MGGVFIRMSRRETLCTLGGGALNGVQTSHLSFQDVGLNSEGGRSPSSPCAQNPRLRRQPRCRHLVQVITAPTPILANPHFVYQQG